MTNKDTITLPREVVELALDALEWAWGCEHMRAKKREAITALRTALAAEPTKPEPVAWMDRFGFVFRGKGPHETFTTPLYTAPPDAEALRRDAERYKWVLNWLWRYGLLSREKTRIDTPESFGDWFVLRKPHSIGLSVGYGKTEDAAIDAAMGDKT